MRRGAKAAKAKVEAELPVARRSLKNKDSRGRKLEKRLAEAFEPGVNVTAVFKASAAHLIPYRDYSMISSICASNTGEIVNPSACAVFRFITAWSLVGCSTGRSAGLAPLMILST